MKINEFIENLYTIKNDKAKMAFLRRLFLSNSSDQMKGLAILARMGVHVSDIDNAMPYMATAYTFSVLKGENGCSFPSALKKATIKEGTDNPFDIRFDRMISCTKVENFIRHHLLSVVNVLKTKNVGVNYYYLLEDLINWKKIKNNWIEQYYC